MFVMTFRKGGLQKAAVVCACGALLVASALGLNALNGSSTKKAAKEVSAQPVVLATQISSAQELNTFLQGFGVQGDIATASVNTVKIPRKWDDSFVAFNDCIKESGLDLTKIKGKNADKWMILVPEQCTENVKTYAVVLVYKNEAVGAYYLQKPAGEVLPLVPKTAGAAALTDEEIAANAGFGEFIENGEAAEDVAAEQEQSGGENTTSQAQETAASVEELSNEGAFPTE